MRWLISILISVVFAAGIILYYQMWKDIRSGQAEIEVLQNELRDYEKLADLYRQQEEKVVIVNALWGEIKNAGLEPDKWVKYPLSMSKTLEWKDVEKMMLLANNKPETSHYWFKPDRMLVSRVLVAPPDSGGQATAPAEADLAAPDTLQMYDMNISGTFLMPKEK
ncbi:hypothetical protein [Desulfocurvus sp. DL9XJH121]